MLFDCNGNEQKAEASKGEVAAAYFSQLFTSTNPDNFQNIFHQSYKAGASKGEVAAVSEEINQKLVRTVTKEEVKEALFSIYPTKAPRTDGMTRAFFQQYWEIIGDQVTKEIQGFFEKGQMPKEWNYTQISLILKIVNASKMAYLRPISLCYTRLFQIFW